ncbi:hypothetical protein, partial [Ancylobacter lacus]|uniref:hypothetical protein n=1 Tax=Ancylobacter lacus TaxID=2579970 RepID=UPI001BCC69C4
MPQPLQGWPMGGLSSMSVESGEAPDAGQHHGPPVMGFNRVMDQFQIARGRASSASLQHTFSAAPEWGFWRCHLIFRALPSDFSRY